MLGGVVNYFLVDCQGELVCWDWLKYFVLGVVVVLIVLFFLNMILSMLFEGVCIKLVDFFVFVGFCLIYVVVLWCFFDNVVQCLFGQIDQVKCEVGYFKQ